MALNPEHNIGIILGGSGQGEAIVANRFPNVRAIVFYGKPGMFSKLDVIRLGREHNDSNVLSLGARFLSLKAAKKAVKEWLTIPFSKAERHIRRIKETEAISRTSKIIWNLNNMIEIIPAIIPQTFEDLKEKMALVKGLERCSSGCLRR